MDSQYIIRREEERLFIHHQFETDRHSGMGTTTDERSQTVVPAVVQQTQVWEWKSSTIIVLVGPSPRSGARTGVVSHFTYL